MTCIIGILAVLLAIGVVWFWVWVLTGSDTHTTPEDEAHVAWYAEAGEMRFTGGRHPDLPDVCTGDFTGTVRVDGKAIKFINGYPQ